MRAGVEIPLYGSVNLKPVKGEGKMEERVGRARDSMQL